MPYSSLQKVRTAYRASHSCAALWPPTSYVAWSEWGCVLALAVGYMGFVVDQLALRNLGLRHWITFDQCPVFIYLLSGNGQWASQGPRFKRGVAWRREKRKCCQPHAGLWDMHLQVQANNIFTVFCAIVGAFAGARAITRTYTHTHTHTRHYQVTKHDR